MCMLFSVIRSIGLFKYHRTFNRCKKQQATGKAGLDCCIIMIHAWYIDMKYVNEKKENCFVNMLTCSYWNYSFANFIKRNFCYALSKSYLIFLNYDAPWLSEKEKEYEYGLVVPNMAWLPFTVTHLETSTEQNKREFKKKILILIRII